MGKHICKMLNMVLFRKGLTCGSHAAQQLHGKLISDLKLLSCGQEEVQGCYYSFDLMTLTSLFVEILRILRALFWFHDKFHFKVSMYTCFFPFDSISPKLIHVLHDQLQSKYLG